MPYRKIDVIIWNDEKFRSLSREAKTFFLYLLTSPHSTAWGVYTIDDLYIQADIGFTPEEITACWKEIINSGLAFRSKKTRTVFLPNFLKYNIPPNAKATTACVRGLLSLPKSPELASYCTRSEWVRENIPEEKLKKIIEFANGSEPVSEQLANSELPVREAGDNDKDKDKDKDKKKFPTGTKGGRCGESNDENQKTGQNAPPVKKLTKADPPSCPHEKIISLYHDILPMCPRVKVWDDPRRANMRARWNDSKERQDLSWWESFFRYVAESPFLTGKKKSFTADLEWLVNRTNMGKVLNGRYHSDNGSGQYFGIEEWLSSKISEGGVEHARAN